jgi:hypothetical protein
MQVQPRAPARKCSSAAPLIVQADEFFDSDSHPFNNAAGAEPQVVRAIRKILRNATAKTCLTSPHVPCCTLPPHCLVSGSCHGIRQQSFRHLTTTKVERGRIRCVRLLVVAGRSPAFPAARLPVRPDPGPHEERRQPCRSVPRSPQLGPLYAPDNSGTATRACSLCAGGRREAATVDVAARPSPPLSRTSVRVGRSATTQSASARGHSLFVSRTRGRSAVTATAPAGNTPRVPAEQAGLRRGAEGTIKYAASEDDSLRG